MPVMMSSAAGPEKHSGDRESHSGIGRKPFAFPPESLFAFSPESCSSSPRNRFHVHPGILFALPRNPHYSLSQMILALVYPLVLGLDRLETASFLRFNGTFQYLTGLPSFPDPQTLRRFLLHAPDSFWEQMHRVNDRLLQEFHPPTQPPVSLDL